MAIASPGTPLPPARDSGVGEGELWYKGTELDLVLTRTVVYGANYCLSEPQYFYLDDGDIDPIG